MQIDLILTWLNSAPQLSGEKLNWNYLPSYSGWSLTIPKAETRTDIIGNTRETGSGSRRRWKTSLPGQRKIHRNILT